MSLTEPPSLRGPTRTDSGSSSLETPSPAVNHRHHQHILNSMEAPCLGGITAVKYDPVTNVTKVVAIGTPSVKTRPKLGLVSSFFDNLHKKNEDKTKVLHGTPGGCSQASSSTPGLDDGYGSSNSSPYSSGESFF